MEGRSRLDNRIRVIQIPWIETANRLTLWLGGKHELAPKILKVKQFKGNMTCGILRNPKMLPVNWEENQQRFILHQHEGMSETMRAFQVLVPQ